MSRGLRWEPLRLSGSADDLYVLLIKCHDPQTLGYGLPVEQHRCDRSLRFRRTGAAASFWLRFGEGESSYERGPFLSALTVPGDSRVWTPPAPQRDRVGHVQSATGSGTSCWSDASACSSTVRKLVCGDELSDGASMGPTASRSG